MQGSISIETAAAAALGDTAMTIKLISASQPVGIRFSYQHALYETGRMIEEIDATTFRVGVFPAVRQAIPFGASLEADIPTCLVHMSDDRGMDIGLSNAEIDGASVEFVEAVDYWNDLALAGM